MKVINDKTKDNIVKLYTESNLRRVEIASILNVSTATIGNVLVERNVQLRRDTRLKRIDINRAVAMYEQGHYLEEIYNVTGIDCCLLYKELDERNVPRRRTYSGGPKKQKESVHTKDVIALYQEGKKVSEIALELLLDQQSVKRIIDTELEKGTIAICPVDIAKEKEKERISDIAKLYTIFMSKEKVTIRQIAKELNVNEQILYRAIRGKQKR